ncbi:hypothetical protein LOC67_17040 [Stieleria sp. JC731]|uniref:hypothetical protein n=1 Tax=Pirellulaceae TaxID=2691357 RepID=UPI001E3071DC|nr:hypothetical protein [Stieleria sp. JC731]MCC9602263.1 hypothetical protein [Stieleria sp. JC731]
MSFALTDTNETSAVQPVWLITASVVETRPYGEGGVETKAGTKHFRAKAKVYIIDAYWGTCENVTVVGHHRASGRFVKMDLPLRYLQNLRISLCYSPTVIELTSHHWAQMQGIPDKEHWEERLLVLKSWPD